MDWQMMKGNIKEPFEAISFEGFFEAANKEIGEVTLEELYADSAKMQAMVFQMIDGLRLNKSFDSSKFVAIKFDNVSIADKIKTWDFGKYNHKVEFFIDPDLTTVILMVHT